MSGSKATLVSRFPEIVRDSIAKTQEALDVTASEVARTARGIVNERTGDLHDTIEAVAGADAMSREVKAGTKSSSGPGAVFYPHFEEFGTRNHGPHPFMVPAAESQAKPFRTRVRDVYP